MASSSSTSSPCAACKFLRRKCTQECVFSPYFPPDHPQKFACVHKVFGASNVAKLLNEIASQHREDAVNSLYYEAEARLRDPVYGCVGLISILQHRLKQLQHETEIARKDLATYIGPQALIPIYNSNLQQSSSPFIALQQPLETQNQQQFVGKSFIPTGQPLFTREQHQQQREQNFQSQLQQHHELMFGYGHQNQNQVEILGFSNGFDTTLTQPQTQTQERVTISALPSLALGTFDNHSSSHHNYQTEQLHLQRRREVAAFVPTQQQTLQTSETLQTQQQSSNNEENRRNVIGGHSLANFENK